MKRNKASVVLAVMAVAGWAAFAAVHAMGWRESVPVLSLTAPEGKSFEQAVVEMGGYVLAYFVATLVAPVLALAAVMRVAWDQIFIRRTTAMH